MGARSIEKNTVSTGAVVTAAENGQEAGGARRTLAHPLLLLPDPNSSAFALRPTQVIQLVLGDSGHTGATAQTGQEKVWRGPL